MVDTLRVVTFGGLLCVIGAGQAASGAISITFDDPTSGSEFFHTTSNGIGGGGDVSFRDDVPVDLQLVGTDDASFLGVQDFSAFLVTEFEVGALVSDAGAVIAEAAISGSFRWVDAISNEVILSGEFSEAAVIQFGLAGSIITTSEIVGGRLAYTPGQVLVDLGVTELFDPQDGVWSLTDVEFADGESIIEIGQDRFFNTFEANAAFTGTAFVPAPGAGALVGLGVLLAGRRRR